MAKGVPVVDDNGSVVGVVTALDILRASQEGKKKLNTMMAKDIMTPNPSVVKKGHTNRINVPPYSCKAWDHCFEVDKKRVYKRKGKR